MKIIKNWLLPLIIAGGLFFIIRPAIAQTLEAPKDVGVGVESIDGYTQIYFENGGGRQFITSGNINSHTPHSSGSYITYVSDINGQGQIFLYDLNSGAKTQLTFVGTNLNPKVDERGRVVWEVWDPSANSGQGSWQVLFFNGNSTKQLTTGDTSLNPDFGGEYISYGRKDITGTWRAVIYSISDDKSIDVTIGENARKPKIIDGNIYLAIDENNKEMFPLKITDLFILNLAPLGESTPSADPILEELSATPSGVVEIPISR